MEDLTFDPEAYSEYMDDINYSQGFYVTPGKDGSVILGGIRRVEGGDRYQKAESAAKFAVEEYNNKAGEQGFLRFITIVNLNVEPTAGALYYITAATEDAAGEICLYQMQIWEKLNTGYLVQIFRPAPYSLKSSEKLAHKNCCLVINNLVPWMDENYLYYKCFKGARQILGIKVCHSASGENTNHAYIWMRNSAKMEQIAHKYGGRKMPRSNVCYTFNLSN
ncbi:hypothetical protein SASPL_104415 [Salvia splendens]|uniref:Cysteine proteinase inhibitor n=1 Tax=Salvia splendens TaxID=180675 RepID=A0A8X8YNJ5_SALSN|nr:uncharacterized protein LOC121772092 [Salvia splendens]KAG6432828.1 hypothetical protein SASPL_104415 [Salvia splendens]